MIIDPCTTTTTTTTSMTLLHELIAGLSITTASMVGVNLFMVRLMWADYKKRHHINGSGSGSGSGKTDD